VFDLGLDGLTQFALHVLAHFSAEAFEAAFFHAEQGEEFIIQLRQLRCGDAVDSDAELSSFTRQIKVLVISRESRVDDFLFASLCAQQSIFKAWDHAAGAQNQLSAFSRAASKSFA